MIITILNVEETQKKNKNGKAYQQLEIAYKDENGKVSSKKIFSFSFPEAYDVLKSATKNQIFNITSEKNDAGYWDWVKAQIAGVAEAGSIAVPDTDQPSKSNKAASTYNDPRETKEERNHRQRMIVRQSSLSNAISFNPGASTEEILTLATTFEDWVMRNLEKTVHTMDDDIPF